MSMCIVVVAVVECIANHLCVTSLVSYLFYRQAGRINFIQMDRVGLKSGWKELHKYKCPLFVQLDFDRKWINPMICTWYIYFIFASTLVCMHTKFTLVYTQWDDINASNSLENSTIKTGARVKMKCVFWECVDQRLRSWNIFFAIYIIPAQISFLQKKTLRDILQNVFLFLCTFSK